MGIHTTYTCDKCNKEIDVVGAYSVQVRIEQDNEIPSGDFRRSYFKLFCVNCYEIEILPLLNAIEGRENDS